MVYDKTRSSTPFYMIDYLHGYSTWEQQRLLEQAQILGKYIFNFLDFSHHQHILEVGMGVGAQTILLLDKFPHLQITGIESSPTQVETAKQNLSKFENLGDRCQIIQADARKIGDLDKSILDMKSIDGVMFIWVLEHVPAAIEVLQEVRRVAVAGTKVYITEVFNSSFFLYPESTHVMNFWRKSIEFQAVIGGDGNIGVRLGNLLTDAGYRNISVRPCLIFVDKRQPAARLEFIQYWKNLMQSMVDGLVKNNYITLKDWDIVAQEMDELMANHDAIFYYTPIQAVAEV